MWKKVHIDILKAARVLYCNRNEKKTGDSIQRRTMHCQCAHVQAFVKRKLVQIYGIYEQREGKKSMNSMYSVYSEK